jgi:hypothetical protein
MMRFAGSTSEPSVTWWRCLTSRVRCCVAPVRSVKTLQDMIRQSGKKRFTKGPAIPLGNARLRKSLWMVTLQLIRRNAWLRQFYERLRAAGKPGKVAVIAAMRKLLVAVWSVAVHRKPFVPILPPYCQGG